MNYLRDKAIRVAVYLICGFLSAIGFLYFLDGGPHFLGLVMMFVSAVVFAGTWWFTRGEDEPDYTIW